MTSEYTEKKHSHSMQYAILKKVFLGIIIPSGLMFIITLSESISNLHNQQKKEFQSYSHRANRILQDLSMSNFFQSISIKESILSKNPKSYQEVKDSMLSYWRFTQKNQRSSMLRYYYMKNGEYYEGFDSNKFTRAFYRKSERKVSPHISQEIRESEEIQDGNTNIFCDKTCVIDYYTSLIPYDNSLGTIKVTLSLDNLARQFAIYDNNVNFTILKEKTTDDKQKSILIDNKKYYFDYTSDIVALNELLDEKRNFTLNKIQYLSINNTLYSLKAFNLENTANVKIIIHKELTKEYNDLISLLIKAVIFVIFITFSTFILIYLFSRRLIKRLQLLHETIPFIGMKRYENASSKALKISKSKDELYKTFLDADSINEKLITLQNENNLHRKKLVEALDMVSKKYEFIKEIMHTTEAAILTVNNNMKITSLNKYAEELFDIQYSIKNDYYIHDVNKNSCLFDNSKPFNIKKGITVKKESYIHKKSKSSQTTMLYYSWSFRYIDHLEQTLIVGINLTQHKETQEKITMLAEKDSLTKTYNRRKAYEIIENYLKEKKELSLLFIDLNNFKTINDTLGHDFGDKVLVDFADLLRMVCPPSAILSRFGGDEFMVILFNTDNQKITQLCNTILDESKKIARNDTLMILNTVSVSIGISSYPTHGSTVDELVAKADAAMYENKITRSGSFRIYNGSETILAKMNKNFELSQFINYVISNKAISCYFQPIVNCNDKTCITYECLARVKKPDSDKFYDTEEFITGSENIKCIDQVDKIIFDLAIAKSYAYVKDNKNITIMVNLSKDTITSPNIIQYIAATLRKYDFPANQLVIEITESTELDALGKFIANLNLLKTLGIRLALDDYGIGYTSLEYLIKLPIDFLKLDMKITKEAVHDNDSLHVIKSIINLTENLQLEVIVEGIETLEAYKLYRSLGVYLMQGYYFSYPSPEFLTIIAPEYEKISS